MKKICFIVFSIILIFFNGFTSLGYAETHRPQVFLKEIRGSKDEGKQIVEHFCASCHAEKPLISIGAPRVECEADWSPRVKFGSKIIWQHTLEGFNAMPPRGGCFECSDEQLLLAIEALLPKLLKEKILNELRDHKKID